MKTIRYIFLIFFIWGVTSCEDVLDEQPNDDIAETTFWITSTDAEAGLIACYDALRPRSNQVPFFWEFWGAFDQLIQIGTIRNGRVRSFSTSTGPADDIHIERSWSAYYRGLVRTNDFMVHIDAIPFENPERKENLIGEARYLRAMYSYGITMIWKDAPYYLNVPGLEAVDIEKTPQQEIINQIKEDLAIAIEKLPDTPNDPGRVGKGAAYMLQLKLALFEEDWDTAVDAAQAVIDLGIYSLQPNYADIFTLENENNSEVIFDIQGIADNDIEPGNTFERFYSNRSSSNSGLSWMNPGLWLVDKYEIIDPSPAYTQDDPRIPTEIYDYFEGRDPRMDANIIRPGAYFVGAGGNEVLYPFINNYTHSRTGLHARKYVVTGDGSRPGAGTSPLNFIVFRYADALLHYAEARVMQSPAAFNDQGVLDAVNAVRARASDQLPLYSPGTFSSADEFLDALYDERIRELPMEGWLYWDFKRWGLIEQRNGFDVMGIELTGGQVQFRSSPVVTQVWAPNKDEYFPLPQAERDVNPNLGQNPGYQ